MGENRLCLGCMENKGEALICPHCGYRENTPFSADYLAPGTILNERYLVGRMIRSNGEGATYIAFDKVISCKVFVREFMPTTLCRRSVSGAMIGSLPNKLPQYKALMAEFSELYKSMARKLRSVNHINRVIDVFFENNTSYAVSEYFDGMDFVEYLKQSTGDISWEQVKKLFAPLFTSLGIVHNAGIIHRGISPETLYVTSRGELKLIGFGTSSVRTKGTELEPELFDGYTAPEQYSPLNRQGTRTDVYGICAVIYRALTGCRPAGAEDRMINDDLCPPDNVNDEIPENVSEVIMRGMAVSGDERIGDITTLVTELFETDKEKDEDKGRTNVISTSEITKQLRENAKEAEIDIDEDTDDYKSSNYEAKHNNSSLDRIKIPLVIGVLLLAILMVIAVILLGFFAKRDAGKSNNNYSMYFSSAISDNIETVQNESRNETLESESGNVDKQMPQLVGKEYSKIKENGELNGITVSPVYEYSESHAKGIIFEQSVKEGEWINSKSPIKIKVSLGSSYIKVPDYTDKTHDEYLQELDALGIKYEEIPEVNYYYYTGYVTRTSIEPGEVINVKNGDVLVVYYANNDWSNNNNWNNNTAAETTTQQQWTTTQQPATEYTAPPVTDLPITDPPVTDAPITDPPITDPPYTDPPYTDPPVTDPPAPEPDINQNNENT